MECSVLIIGCGYIGKMLGNQLLNRGNPVVGTVTSVEGASLLEAQGIIPLVADLDVSPGERLISLSGISPASQITWIVYPLSSVMGIGNARP